MLVVIGSLVAVVATIVGLAVIYKKLTKPRRTRPITGDQKGRQTGPAKPSTGRTARKVAKDPVSGHPSASAKFLANAARKKIIQKERDRVILNQVAPANA